MFYCQTYKVTTDLIKVFDDYACNDTNAIPTRSRYAGTYAAAIAGRYGWEGLGGLRMGCGWLARLVSVGGAGRSGILGWVVHG